MPTLPVCKATDIPDGGAAVIPVNGKDVAVFNCGGTFFAIDDTCPHAGASLSGGHVEKGIVTCPMHGWRFRLADGKWADNPRVGTGCYRVQVRNGLVELDVPDPAGT